MERGDHYKMVIDHKIAQKKNLKVGDKLIWKEKEFIVVGIMEPIETAPDHFVLMPIETVRRLLKQPHVTHFVNVVPQDPGQADALAERIIQEINVNRGQRPPKGF
ncbi:MAG: ABC transporter permease [Anaerolineae bacterium]|nr:ABC transporter permease [Anaerolineae bacterium]MDW8102124.1 ABC transporter permease [Anaerolineae bacterium]